MTYTIPTVDDAIYHELLFIYDYPTSDQVINGVGHKESKQWKTLPSKDYLRSILN